MFYWHCVPAVPITLQIRIVRSVCLYCGPLLNITPAIGVFIKYLTVPNCYTDSANKHWGNITLNTWTFHLTVTFHKFSSYFIKVLLVSELFILIPHVVLHILHMVWGKYFCVKLNNYKQAVKCTDTI